MPAHTNLAPRTTNGSRTKATPQFRKTLIHPGLISLFGLAALWQGLATLGLIDSFLVPPPLAILSAMIAQTKEGTMARNISASLLRVGFGTGGAALVAIPLGIITGWTGWGDRWVRPVIEFLRPIPPIAWIPLAIFWFGIGDTAAGFIVFLGAFFPIFVNTFVGIRSVEQTHKEAALTLGSSGWLLVTDVLIPSALPHVLAGVRIGLGFGWMAVVAAELIAADSGLGYDIGLNRNLLRTDRILAGMATIGIIGSLMNLGMERLGRFLLPWRTSGE